jgi:hypothetical protein
MHTNLAEHGINALHLDLDGFDVAIDNCTTGHITCDQSDFIDGSYVPYATFKAWDAPQPQPEEALSNGH